jgi:hypothetical protein
MKFHRQLTLISVALLAITTSGCSQLGPNDGDVKKSLQGNIPAYWNVESISLENKENLGTESDPTVQARFKAVLGLKEDTFKPVLKPDLIRLKNTSDVIFVAPAEKKGKTVELYGVELSKKYTDSWKTEFKPDNDPVTALGKPRSFFNGKTVLANSPEEKAFFDEANKQVEDDRKSFLSKLLSTVSQGTMNGNNPFFLSDFKIRFTSGKDENDKLSGQMTFRGGVIKGFDGALSKKELKFTVNKLIQGKDSFGLGTVYTFPVDSLDPRNPVLEGTWNHTDGRTGEIKINQLPF